MLMPMLMPILILILILMLMLLMLTHSPQHLTFHWQHHQELSRGPLKIYLLIGIDVRKRMKQSWRPGNSIVKFVFVEVLLKTSPQRRLAQAVLQHVDDCRSLDFSSDFGKVGDDDVDLLVADCVEDGLDFLRVLDGH